MAEFDGDTEILDIASEVDDSEEAVVLDSDDDDVANVGNGSVSGYQWRSGYIRRGVKAACASTLCGNDFAAVNISDELNNLASGSIHSDPFSQKHFDIKDEYSSEREVVEAVPSRDGVGCNGHMYNVDDKTKKIQGLSKVSTRNRNNEGNVSENKFEASDNKKLRSNSEQEAVKMRDSESQESEDLSQANALGFVDHYLSLNKMHFLENDAPGKASRLKSPPRSCTKGTQKLARRVNTRTSCGLSRTFEWDDDHMDKKEEHVLQIKNMNTNLDGSKSRYVKHSCNHKFTREKTCTEFSTPLAETCKAVDMGNQVPNMNFVKELDDEWKEKGSLQTEAGNIGDNVPDAYDVGFDTQMAAEAMEALFYAPPLHFNADHAHQDPGNITGNSSVAKEDNSNSGLTRRQFNQKHGSSKKLNGQSSKFTEMNKMELDSKLLEPKIRERRKRLKSLTKTNCKSLRHVNVSVHSCTNSVYFTEKGKKAKALGRDNIKEVGEDLVSSTSGENNSCRQVPLQKKKRNLLSTVYRTRHLSIGHMMDETKDQVNSSAQGMNGGLELGVRKRRRNNENAEMLQGFTVKRKRSETCFRSSGEAGNVKESQKQQKYVNLGPVGEHSKLIGWSFPKGKRKNRKARHPLNRLSPSLAPILVKGELSASSSISSPKRSEENSRSSCLKVYVRRNLRSQVHDHQVQSALELNSEDLLRQKSRSSCLKVYVRRKSRPLVHDHQVQSKEVLKCEDSLRKNSEVQSSTSVVCLPSANEEITVPEDKFEASRFCGNMCNAGPISPLMAANKFLEKPHNARASLNVSKNPQQVCDRKCSRVPLMKELISLEISDSGLTGELKLSRRRRDIKNVRVLFSQNMDDTIIKKQKKILGRLGSFIASSCSEATHFVADRFVRTKNMLEAIALGIPVVTHTWIVSCGQAKFFVDEKNYVLRDAKKEREIGFSMPISLSSARKAPLLEGRRVYVTPNINPGKELIVSLVKAVNGEVLSEVDDRCDEAVTSETISDDLLILSCEQDYALCAPFLEQGTVIYSSELLLNGIVIQKLEFERHRIFENHH